VATDTFFPFSGDAVLVPFLGRMMGEVAPPFLAKINDFSRKRGVRTSLPPSLVSRNMI